MILEQVNEQYEEHRNYPRLKLDMPALILCVDQHLVKGHVHDISPDGLQIRSSRKDALAINPEGKQISPKDRIMVNVVFDLPSKTGDKQIKVICNIYYFTLTHDDGDKDIAFGLKFIKFDGTCGRYVDQFFIRKMEPDN